MKTQQVKFKSKGNKYSILIGKNILKLLSKNIKTICPKAKKIALIFDKKFPSSQKKIILKNLKNYKLSTFIFDADEKAKSFHSVNYYLNNLFLKNFNRSDVIIGIGGGITGDITGFIASIFKRGINFINIPTTLLAQSDASIGGKTGINSSYGKNLIGAFYQPKLVISDINFLKSLNKKEMICGYAEILKHSVIKDKNFFNWLKANTQNVLMKESKKLIYAIKRSCEIKLYFVNKDEKEKNLRMMLNFGHTFAHAIEVKNNFSKKITHGEAVLAGMIIALKLSFSKRICSRKTFDDLTNIYKKNKLDYTFKRYININEILSLVSYLKNDKKNHDEKVNFILLKNIGKTTLPNTQKISINQLKKQIKKFRKY